MLATTLGRSIAAEALGTAALVATVIGSGAMAAELAGGNLALALLGNTLATGAMLTVLILVLGPVSGAHFNPVISLVFALRRELSGPTLALYVAAQVGGGIIGALLAHAMFALPPVSFYEAPRTGTAQWLSETVATFGLMATILGLPRSRATALPFAVGLYISAAYWFTASTAFANPAVAVARSLTATFAGIRVADLPGFIAAEALGAVLAWAVFGWLLSQPTARPVRPIR